MWKRWMATAALAGATAAAAQQPAYNAGMTAFEVPYHGGRMEVTLWYPARAAEALRSFGPYRPSVALGAAAVEGQHPLVLVSHGTGGGALNHHLQAEALARRGYLVASLVHPGDNFRDRSMSADARYFFERPRQLRHLLDQLLAHPQWRQSIDPARIGAIGHSAGGYSVAALAGGVPDTRRMQQHCAAVADDPACVFRDPRVGVAVPGAAPLQLPASSTASGDVRDERIRAAVLMAPLGQPIVPGSLARSTAMVKIIGAEHDEVLPHAYHYEPLRAQLPPGGQVRLVAGAGHYAFIVPTDPAWKDRLGPVPVDPPGFDREQFHRQLSDEIVGFFEQALRP